MTASRPERRSRAFGQMMENRMGEAKRRKAAGGVNSKSDERIVHGTPGEFVHVPGTITLHIVAREQGKLIRIFGDHIRSDS
jgi:hypothetical protein